MLEDLLRAFDGSGVKPKIDRVFPFEATSEALAYIETGRSKGKVVVKLK